MEFLILKINKASLTSIQVVSTLSVGLRSWDQVRGLASTVLTQDFHQSFFNPLI